MGKAVQIVKIDDESETHKFFLDEEALNEILNKDNIRDKPICIISVAGSAFALAYFVPKLRFDIECKFADSNIF